MRIVVPLQLAGPVVQTFLWDIDLKERLRLDAVVTLVDCKHALKLLAPPGCADRPARPAPAAEALDSAAACREQIAFADRLLLNKAGLASPPRPITAPASPAPLTCPPLPRRHKGRPRLR